MNSAKLQIIKPTQKTQLYFYIPEMSNQLRKLRKNSIYKIIKKNKIFRNKFIQGDVHLHTENQKTLLKEIKDLNKWNGIPRSWAEKLLK